MWFVVRCLADIPKSGEVVVRGAEKGIVARLSLEPVTDARRRAAYEALLPALDQWLLGNELQTAVVPREDLVLLETRLPALKAVFAGTAPRPVSEREARKMRETWRLLAQQPTDGSLFMGRLPALVQSAHYQIYLGDAWTNAGLIQMIPLPVVEPEFNVVPPTYAAAEEDVASHKGACTFTVLAGSQVNLRVDSANAKPLRAVGLHVNRPSGVAQHPLVPAAAAGTRWVLPRDCEALRSVTEELRYEIVVTDQDGMRPRESIVGQIRVRRDQPPTALMHTVHRVVLPSATPRLEYRVDDDHAVAGLRLLVAVERAGASDAGASGSTTPEALEFVIGRDQVPLQKSELPHQGSYSLELSSLDLVKGDELKLTLAVTDARGETAGHMTLSEPLFFEVSDEAGVLAAIAEVDEQAERELDDMIQRQLGVGEGR